MNSYTSVDFFEENIKKNFKKIHVNNESKNGCWKIIKEIKEKSKKKNLHRLLQKIRVL